MIFETLKLLAEPEQHLVITYAIGGGLLTLFASVAYQCKKVIRSIRLPIAFLMGAVGFAFMSAAGRILEGYDDTLTSITSWGVLISTCAGLWTVIALWHRHKRKAKEDIDCSLDEAA